MDLSQNLLILGPKESKLGKWGAASRPPLGVLDLGFFVAANQQVLAQSTRPPQQSISLSACLTVHMYLSPIDTAFCLLDEDRSKQNNCVCL